MSVGLGDLAARAQERISEGDLAGARDLLGAALSAADPSPAHATPELASTAALLAKVLVSLGDPQAARGWAAFAYAATTRLHGPHDARTTDAAVTLAAVLHRVGNHARAARLYHDVILELSAADGPESQRVLAAHADLATVEYARGECATARTRLEDAWELHREVYGDGHPAGIRMLARLGAMERDCGRYTEAHQHLALAQELCRTHLPPDHPLVTQVAALARAAADPDHVCTVEDSAGLAAQQGPPPPRTPLAPTAPSPFDEGPFPVNGAMPAATPPSAERWWPPETAGGGDPGRGWFEPTPPRGNAGVPKQRTQPADPDGGEPAHPADPAPPPVEPDDWYRAAWEPATRPPAAPRTAPEQRRPEPAAPADQLPPLDPEPPHHAAAEDEAWADPAAYPGRPDLLDAYAGEGYAVDDQPPPAPPEPPPPAGPPPAGPPPAGPPPPVPADDEVDHAHQRVAGLPAWESEAARDEPPIWAADEDGVFREPPPIYTPGSAVDRRPVADPRLPERRIPDNLPIPYPPAAARRPVLPLIVAGVAVILLGAGAVIAGFSYADRDTGTPPPTAAATAPPTSGPTAAPTAAPTPPPAAAPGTPPGDVTLADGREQVTLRWTYPAGAEGPVQVSGGRDGQTPRAFQELPAGSTTWVVYGLDPAANYCFQVAVVYSTDTLGAAAPVCTRR